jgi:hypothetical protein
VDLLLLAILSAAMAWSMLRQPEQPFFRPVVLAFLAVAFYALPLAWSGTQVEEAQQMLRQQVDELQAPQGVDKEEFQERVNAVARWLLYFLPASSLGVWLAVLTLSGWVIRRGLVSRGKLQAGPPLSLWRAPDWMIWLFLGPAIICLAGINGWFVSRQGEWFRAAANLAALVSVVYLFQGAQVLRWRLTKAKSPWIVWVLFGLAFLFLGAGAFFSLGVALALIGMLDLWLDFRRIITPPDPKDGSQGDDE